MKMFTSGGKGGIDRRREEARYGEGEEGRADDFGSGPGGDTLRAQ